MRLPSVLAGLLGGILASGILLLLLAEPRGQPIALRPPPTPPPMRVHVTGAVQNPGVYALPAGSHVEDALRAAGGATDDAADDLINLVEPLRDGQRLTIPVRAAASSPGQPATGQTPAAAPGLLDVNQASAAQLEALPGIGPVLAGSIVEYRAANGPFSRLEDLLRVPGIGPAKLEQLAPYLVAP